MKRNLRSFFALWLAVAISSPAFAQFSGNDGPEAGATEYYTYFLDVYTTSPGFNLSGGTAMGESHNGTDHTITVRWDDPGSGSITFVDGSTPYDTYYVTIYCPYIANPSTTFSYTQNCGNTVITRNASPGAGITWYWQTSSSGTATTSSGSTYTVTAGGTYYLRARSTSYSTCWSSGSASTSSVTVNAVPGTVTSPTGASRCGTGTLTLSATTGSGGSGVKWYSASSGGTLLYTGTSYTTPSISSTTNYFACTYISSTGCESARTSIAATINTVPGNATSPSSNPVAVYGSGSVTLSASGAGGGETYAWYTVSSGGTALSSNTPSLSSTTTYYVARKVTETGCESASRVSVAVPVYAVATISPSTTQYLAYGGSVTLTANSGYFTYQWVRNDTVISGATSASYIVRRTGVYKVDVTGASGAPTHRSTSGVTVSSPTAQALNLVSATQVYKEGLKLNSVLDTLSRDKLSQTISYMDGMGRPFQTIAVAASPDEFDMVSATGPEKQGLAITSYLPYVSEARNGLYRPYALRNDSGVYVRNGGTAGSEQYEFYQNAAQVAHDTKPYAKVVYRQTPDARAIESGAPGVNWQPDSAHTVRSQITFNVTADSVRKWNSTGVSSGYYAEHTVVVQTTTDENGNQVKTFINALGQTVLKKVQYESTKWLKTYYVYDDYGRLKYQVPPRAVGLLDSTPNLAEDTPLAELIYRYDYDDRDRVIAKKIPGATDEEYIVYDKLDRVVLTQDGNLKAQGKWMFIKYDFYGRPAYSGLYTSSSSRATLQTALNDENYNQSGVKWYEYETSGTYDYSNQAYPRSNTTALAVYYYDHYDFNRDTLPDYTYDNAHLTSGQEGSAQSLVRAALPVAED